MAIISLNVFSLEKNSLSDRGRGGGLGGGELLETEESPLSARLNNFVIILVEKSAGILIVQC